MLSHFLKVLFTLLFLCGILNRDLPIFGVVLFVLVGTSLDGNQVSYCSYLER